MSLPDAVAERHGTRLKVADTPSELRGLSVRVQETTRQFDGTSLQLRGKAMGLRGTILQEFSAVRRRDSALPFAHSIGHASHLPELKTEN